MKILLTAIAPNPEQPRGKIEVEALEDLVESIRLHGVINPISVEDRGNGMYTIIDGERRWRAARLAGLSEIEASVRPGLNGSGELERLLLATVANVQREDMSALDKAKAFQNLLEQGLTQEEVARTVGLSLASVQNYLLILRLPETLQRMVGAGALTGDARAVRAVLSLGDEGAMMAVARGAATRHLGADQVVALARRVGLGRKNLARGKAKGREELSRTWAGRWNMVAQAGNPRLSETLHAAAVETCKECALAEAASPKMCRDCPAVGLLKRLKEAE